MKSLDQAIETLIGAGAQKNRPAALAELDRLVGDCERARKLWQDYLDSPGAAGDRFSLVTWMGAARVKALHEVHLEVRARTHRICELADPGLARLVLLEDDVIEMAFRGLREGESGPDAAQAAIATMDGRIAHLRKQIDRLRAAPARAAAKKPAAGQAAKKPAARRPGGKPETAARRKPVAKKKPAKKKSRGRK